MSDASHIDLNNETDRKTVLEKIATLIKRIPNRGISTKPMLAAEILNRYIERTEEHIKLVRNCGLKLIPFIEEKGISSALFEQELSAHDHDKLDNFDIVPIYAAYTQLVYNNDKYKDTCRLEDGVEKEFNEVAWPLHYKLNSHHVGEHFGKLVDGCYVVESDKHFIEIAHMVADWMAMGREMNNSATVWWSKCKQENKYSFKEEDVAWIEKLLLVENDTKQVPIDTSIEDIHPNAAKQIVNGLIYHGSPVKTTILKANKNKAHGTKHGVFVSPFKGIAACFVPDEKEIIERLKKQGIDTTSINFQYSKWNEDYKTLQDLPNPLEIYLGNPAVKEFKGVARGYIYTIDYSKYKDKSKMFTLAKDSDVEFILDCDVTPLKCEEVKIPYIVKYSELAQQEGSQEDIDPMDAIMLSNDTSGITDSMERFYVNDKSLEQELLAIPRLDAKTLLATLKPGDLIVTYPKVSTFSNKISYTLNSFVQRMAFSSIKLVGTNNDVVGYGVTGKLMLQSAKIEQLPTLFSGITVLRHKQLNTTTVKKIYSWVYDKLTKDIPYDKFGILKAIVERLFKIPGVQLTSDTIDNSISALYCSTILHLAFKKFGLDTGISIIGDFNIFPKDFLYSKMFNKVGLYLDDGEDTSTEESRINKITKLARAQYDADGPNQWPHINRVLREGYVYCKLLKIEMSDTLYTAIMFHDCAKGDSKKDHGKESSKKAKPLLEPFFTKQELSEILIAIAEHNNNKPGTSQTSELLKAADANILDIAWFLSKLYWKRKNKGMSEDVIYKDCLETIQKGYLTFDHEGAYRPKYWTMRYEKELPKAQQTIAALTEDAVKKMIKAQLAKTNNAPSYESIESNKPNLESLPDHVEIKKSKISGNGIFSTIDLKENVIVGVGFYYTQPNKKLNPDKDIHRTMLGKYVNHSATPNCILKTEIRNKTHIFLFITNKDIKRDTELTIDYRLIPWEGEREFTNKSSSNEDLVINQHTSIKEIVESNKPENTISIGLENLDISTEAAAAISTKKKAILDYICKYCDIMDPSKLNSERYKKLISGMTDKQFDTFMHDMRDGKFQLHIVAPNMKVNLKVKDMIAAADSLKLKLFHRIWMRDNATGRKFLSDNEYLVVKLPVRRQEQFIDKKMSVPDNDRSIDGLTGQVSWDSKACAITNPEIQILAARNMDATLFELVNVRGGNINSYAELKRSLEENGEARLNDLDPGARSRVAVMGGVLLTAMLIDSNL